MTILHVTDFHFNQRWFDWLLHRAPAHDLVVMSGDMLDLSIATPAQRQIQWVSDWLRDFPRPLCVCSGNHDLQWDSEAERWTPAYWLRAIPNPLVWTDAQRVQFDGLSFLNIGATTRPKGGDADVWVVHAPPSNTLVGQRDDGADAGDPDLIAPVRRFRPRLVLTGHVHSPRRWHDHRDTTLFLNPGRNEGGLFPNHLLIQTDPMSCQLITARTGERDREFLLPATIDAASARATTVVT
jgi:predicted phosphodiesterase